MANKKVEFLVIAIGKNMGLKPYSDQYRIFTTVDAALDYAKECGYRDDFGMGVSPKPGIMNLYAAGDVHVSILPLEVIEPAPKTVTNPPEEIL